MTSIWVVSYVLKSVARSDLPGAYILKSWPSVQAL